MMDWPQFDDPVRNSYRALHRYASAAAPDTVFLDDMQARIDAARYLGSDRACAAANAARPRVLLLGYHGAGNTGADLRTIETIAQLRRIFAPREPVLTLFALGDVFDHAVLAQTPRLAPTLPYVPDALDAAIREADLVVNVEGSTYTSKFSDSLSGILIGGVALAHAYGLPAVSYGVDSGAMSEPLTRFVAHHAARAGHVICRNAQARVQLRELGVETIAGADAAWTWRAPAASPGPHASPSARVAALCPTNPFWWPVRADAARARALDARGETSPHRYGLLHFHTWDDERERAYEAYLARFAAVATALRARGYTPVIVGMEQVDRAACLDLAARLPFDAACVVRGERVLDEVASAVAHAQCVVTTRYHASVLALSHGVPVFGLSMDTRIDRLLAEADCESWLAHCDADDALQRCIDAIDSLEHAGVRERLRAKQRHYAQQQRAKLDAMGRRLMAIVEAAGQRV
ncbi:polysaccharide pyruvyl transferase family protein [Paraburkholderia tropica]|uniref:polysaccharide pyruvyl transferase family protein n=1 Tax=Paraburkholderia tropica TaxID=92647 RepID=UPI002AB6AA73|nr:polysaccharide pyruvyl transferase family protein [Paraburkholderia tropica]